MLRLSRLKIFPDNFYIYLAYKIKMQSSRVVYNSCIDWDLIGDLPIIRICLLPPLSSDTTACFTGYIYKWFQ